MKQLLYCLLLLSTPVLAQHESATAHHQALQTLNHELSTHARALAHPKKSERKAFEREVAREHLRGMEHCLSEQRRHVAYLKSQGNDHGMSPRQLRQMSTYHDQNVRHHRRLQEALNHKALRKATLRSHSRKIYRNTQKTNGILS